MKTMIKIIFITLCIQGCKKNGEYPLFVKNNSTYSISVFFNDNENHEAIYPDTSISAIQQGIIHIPKGEKEAIAGSRNWESVFDVTAPNDTMSIFILHTDTLARYSWTEVQNKYKILKRYDLSLGDLERLDFTITYPPDASMQGVKMYPR